MPLQGIRAMTPEDIVILNNQYNAGKGLKQKFRENQVMCKQMLKQAERLSNGEVLTIKILTQERAIPNGDVIITGIAPDGVSDKIDGKVY